MTKITLFFGIPIAVIQALGMVGYIGDTVSNAATLVVLAVQAAVAGYLDPRVPWYGNNS